jgi:hypothetical protein
VVAVLFVLVYVGVAVARMSYPYELEWIEGGLLQAMSRVLDGRPLYVKPSLEYVPFNYPPLYPWIAALVSKGTGDGFLPLRLTSFLASLGAFVVAGWLVWRETGRLLAATLTVGLLAATYRISGAWFDVARADSLYLFLLLGGFTTLRLDRTPWRSPLIAGALFTLAFLAKQSAAMVVLPLLIHLAWTQRMRFLVFAGALTVGIGGTTLLLDRMSSGWYRYFLFVAPARHPVEAARVFDYWPRDIFMPMGLALLIGAAYLLQPRPAAAAGDEVPAAPSGQWFYAAMLAGTLLSSWFHRMFPGGYDNVLMPAYATIAIVFGLGVHAGLRWLAELPGDDSRRLATALQVAIALQLLALAYNPLAQIPTDSDRTVGDRFVEKLRSTPGRVLIPSHPYLVRLAGKPDHFHEMAFVAVVEIAKGDVERELVAELEQAVRDTAYSTVVLSTRGWLGSTIRTGYDPATNLFTDPEAFWPVTGMRTRPEYVYLPRRPAAR